MIESIALRALDFTRCFASLTQNQHPQPAQQKEKHLHPRHSPRTGLFRVPAAARRALARAAQLRPDSVPSARAIGWMKGKRFGLAAERGREYPFLEQKFTTALLCVKWQGNLNAHSPSPKRPLFDIP